MGGRSRSAPAGRGERHEKQRDCDDDLHVGALREYVCSLSVVGLDGVSSG
jgi:hypothetical protein